MRSASEPLAAVHAELADATLVLLGHGSTVNAESSAPVYQHAAEIRCRRCFAEVREAFWKQPPQIADVLANLRTPRVFLVPLFISEGYFGQGAIPRALGFRMEGLDDTWRVQRQGGQTRFYCKPIGTHESMTDIVLARAREVVASAPFPRAPRPEDTTLFIAGHGTEQNENSRRAIERQAESIGALDHYAGVHAVFLEEEPRIGLCYQMAQARNIVMVPFFISDGMHTQEDIPILLGEPRRVVQRRLRTGQPTWRNPTERKGKLVWYSASVGTDPRVAVVILERVKEVALRRRHG